MVSNDYVFYIINRGKNFMFWYVFCDNIEKMINDKTIRISVKW